MDYFSSDNDDVICTAVTCLICIGDTLCSGEGSYLHTYSLSSSRHLAQYNVLGSSVIHGIKASSNDLVIFGQKSLCLGRLTGSSFDVTSEVAEFTDWIWDVQWLSEPLHHLAVALGHNAVALWDCSGFKCTEVISCVENCILYSACFIGDSWNSLVLAAGVVFNEVVLWRPAGHRDGSGRSIVIGRFKGHEGVIFNIDYNPEKCLLCSVSDDRTIRLWDLRLRDGCTSGDPIRTLYGHRARVWDAKLMTDVIVSIGEDACCFVWNYEGSIIKKFTGHKGQNIWSVAVNESKHLIVTGGGDSSIRLWSLATIADAEHTTECLDMEVAARSVLGEAMTEEMSGFTPRLVSLLRNELLVMMQNGYLLGYGFLTKTWRLIVNNPEYQSYCIMKESPDNRLVAIGTIKGHVFVHRLDDGARLLQVSVYSSKVLSLCWGSGEDIFSSGPEGAVIWWKVAQNENGKFDLTKICDYILCHSRHRWLTSVTILPDDVGFVCGDKRGSVFLYRNGVGSKSEDPCDSHIAIHGKTGVSFIAQHDGFLYSAGRDGTYRKYSVTEGWKLRLIHTFKVQKGFDWLEKLIFTSSDLLVMGFHSAYFVVHNATTNETLMKVNCGGGHRSWGVVHTQDQTTFAYIKTKKVVIYSTGKDYSGHVLLKPHLHGRVIRCICFLGQLHLTDGSECGLLATGSEDTDVNISAVRTHPNRATSVVTLHRLQDHISSVSSLASYPSLNSTNITEAVLLVSVGGRVTVNISRVSFPTEEVEGSLEASVTLEHLASSGTIDNAARRRQLKKLREANTEPDPETRFMDVKVHRPNEGDVAFLYIAGSDGLLRLFVFHEYTRDLLQLYQSASHQCCFLSLLLHEIRLPNSVVPLLCSGATDGKLMLWDMSSCVNAHEEKQQQQTCRVASDSKRLLRNQTIAAHSRSTNLSGLNFEDETSKEQDPSLSKFSGSCELGTNFVEEVKEDQSGFVKVRSDNSEDFNLITDNQSADGVKEISSPSVDEEEEFSGSSEGISQFGEVALTLTTHQSGINALASKQLEVNL
ncbi:tRNA (34-2'-O)-methyltransferase regulator WDR6-like isoform X2 [Apostichopus japonicus]|uniref:tRNA (34-2'-O)-methyltransferase regulator WDR6-like isoform X2 n=1 Tax=Stichopus japonicus TaxID=307972 RepID=UPI003AB4040D